MSSSESTKRDATAAGTPPAANDASIGDRVVEDNAPASGTTSPENYAAALHEVSNALTVVLGWLELAKRAKTLADKDKAIAVALEHSRRGQVMSRRAIGARADSQRTRRTAGDVTEFAAISVRPQADEVHVTIETDLGEGTDCQLSHDSTVLQILTNLLLNAIVFSPERSKVTISSQRDGDALRFTVRDEGPGITGGQRAHLFTAPTSTRSGGAGIGLPHSRALAREAGGDLVLLPSPEGALFELSWPVQGSSAVRPSVRAEAATALSTARVLVLEDDAAIASLVELSFEARGAQVIVVDGPEQLQKVLDGSPVLDVALLDLSPIKDELTGTLDALDATCPGIRNVLMSGQPTGVPKEADGRFASWVRKPFDMEQLISTVAKLIAG